jgi:hypothetical protein
MSPGVVDEVGKATGSFIDALKREPLSLALVLMNLALLGFFWLILNAVAAQREREINLLYEDKKEVRELIAKCIVPDRTELQNRAALPLNLWPPLPLPLPRSRPPEADQDQP